MMRVRRYLRDSGKVLAFVFVASVVWLLFDMAALRMSLNDVNSQLLRERVVREKEMFKQQLRATQQHVKRVFKHPVERVDWAVTHARRGQGTSGVKLDQVYRHGGKEQEKKWNFIKKQGGDVSRREDGAVLYNFTPNQGVPGRKKKVDFDLNVAVANITHKNQLSRREEPVKGGQSLLDKKAPKANKAVRKQLHKEEARRVKTTAAQPPNTDEEKRDEAEGGEQLRVTVASPREAEKEPVKASVSLHVGGNSTAVRKAGVHKVLALDMTSSPRDATAVGQFGQAAVAGWNEDAEVRKRWDEGHFNVYLSEKIPLDRAVPDTRPEM